jgi:5-methylcytosine-specific restriction protein A
MPYRAKQVCRAPGCGQLCDGSFCEKHAGSKGKAPGPHRPRLYDRRRWRDRLRKLVLARDPLCRIAVLCDGTALSTEVDHVIPLAAGGNNSMDNLEGSCHACHSHKTSTEQARGLGGNR